MFRAIVHSLAFRATVFPISAFRATVFPVLAFRATVFSVSEFRATIFSVWGVQSCISSLVFRATISSSVYRSKTSSSLVWCLESHLQFGVQSLHILRFGVQSRRSQHSSSFVNLELRAITSSIWHSKPLLSLAFKATIFLQFGVQSHVPSIQSCPFLLVWRSEPHCQHLGLPFSFSLAFRVILTILSHFHQFRCSESYPQFGIQTIIFFSLAFRVVSSFWHSKHLSGLAFGAAIFLQFRRLELLCILIPTF